jgi:hypothetical protein
MLPTKFRFIWPSSFRGEDLKKSANQKQELPVAAEGFQRRRLKCEKLTDDRQRTTSDGKNSHCLWQGELTMLKFFGFVSVISVEHKTYIDFLIVTYI